MRKNISLCFLLSICALTSTLFQSCGECKDYNYKIIEVIASIGTLQDGDTLRRDTLFMTMFTQGEKLPMEASLIMPSVIPTARALDCFPDYFLKDTLLSITITNDSVFGSNASGQNINGLFTLIYNGGYLSSPKDTIPMVQQEKVRFLFNSKDRFNKEMYTSLNLFCTAKPAQQQPIRFIVQYTFADGSTVKDTTQRIIW